MTRLRRWIAAPWPDVLLSAALVIAAGLGYVALFAWMVTLGAFKLQ